MYVKCIKVINVSVVEERGTTRQIVMHHLTLKDIIYISKLNIM